MNRTHSEQDHFIELVKQILKDSPINQTTQRKILLDKALYKINSYKISQAQNKQVIRLFRTIKSSSTKQEIQQQLNMIRDNQDFGLLKSIVNMKIIFRQFVQCLQNICLNKDSMKTASIINDILKQSSYSFGNTDKRTNCVKYIKKHIAQWLSSQIYQLKEQSSSFEKYCRKIKQYEKQIKTYQKIQEQNQQKIKLLECKIFEYQQKHDEQQFQQPTILLKPKLSPINHSSKQQQYTQTNLQLLNKEIQATQQLQIEHKQISTQLITNNTQVQVKQLTFSIEVQVVQQVQNKSTQATQTTQDISIQNIPLVQEQSIQTIQDKNQDKMIQQFRNQLLFQEEIFLENFTQKKRFIHHIESKSGLKIKRTKLLYKYDPYNPTNFHKYIDNIMGLALIVKLKSGFFIGGYYSDKLTPNEVMNKFGLLVSISNDQSYILRQPQKNSPKIFRSMVYDEYYAIYGNAQLRVKAGQDFIFSNFGIMNSYFDNKNKKIFDFNGQASQGQVKFQLYQFYQVILHKAQ